MRSGRPLRLEPCERRKFFCFIQRVVYPVFVDELKCCQHPKIVLFEIIVFVFPSTLTVNVFWRSVAEGVGSFARRSVPEGAGDVRYRRSVFEGAGGCERFVLCLFSPPPSL